MLGIVEKIRIVPICKCSTRLTDDCKGSQGENGWSLLLTGQSESHRRKSTFNNEHLGAGCGYHEWWCKDVFNGKLAEFLLLFPLARLVPDVSNWNKATSTCKIILLLIKSVFALSFKQWQVPTYVYVIIINWNPFITFYENVWYFQYNPMTYFNTSLNWTTIKPLCVPF